MAKTAAGHGREPSITDARTRKICDAIKHGSAFEVAARYAGVPKDTFWGWVRKGRGPDPEPVYAKFVVRIDEAFAEFKVERAKRLSEAGGKDGDWRADAFALERRDPENWGKTTRVEGQVTHQAIPWIDYSKLNDEELDTLIQLLEKGRPDPSALPRGAVAGPPRELEAAKA